MLRLILCLAVASNLAACSYKATAPVSASYDVYSNYDTKVPGYFALYVESDEMQGEFKVSGVACSAHKYPLDARSAFEISTLKTLENLVERVELVDSPLSQESINSGGYDGLIIVRSEDLDVRLIVIPGFWSHEMEADVEMVASAQIESANGRVFGTTVSADEDFTSDAGSACDGGANAISEAASDAMKELMQELGERIANSERVRDLAVASGT